ncbi:M48 family metallopeptidase [Pseudoalteromonas sp. DL2-H2.2]|uniref:M48 family metallopeptidase n=1 Tax=Pseudoalteromonas sp. DL2-H2.2 TaxID=2908889 RepID=UPI001F24D7F9|nr:M48 family metallopeptidase [Pseudoalteromonas sp. DL2-H2.2]MCF2910124.1 M48 family metallopeptidase [Pseudoalteromonas sp. DL2-H2.2]
MIPGYFYQPNSSRVQEAVARLSGNQVAIYAGDECLRETMQDTLSVSAHLPGQASELTFTDGARFVPLDVTHRWSFQSGKSSLLASLESNLVLIVCALVATPVLLYALLFKLVPEIAVTAVEAMPDAVVEQMGQQSMVLIERTALSPSELSAEQQQAVRDLWQDTLAQLDLSADKYRIDVYRSDHFGANAFALPHGQVVVTDELALILAEHPDALRAILLHEIGHVERMHSVRLASQAAVASIAIAMLIGDMDIVAEVVLGSGSALMDLQFSQNMEWEADNYALAQLARLGYSGEDFAQALESLVSLDEDEEHSWLKYLSTHPSLQERIEHARTYTPSP